MWWPTAFPRRQRVLPCSSRPTVPNTLRNPRLRKEFPPAADREGHDFSRAAEMRMVTGFSPEVRLPKQGSAGRNLLFV